MHRAVLVAIALSTGSHGAECIVEGDFLVRVYHSNSTAVLGNKESQLCHFTLRTDFVVTQPMTTRSLSYVLTKAAIDDASENKRFPDHFTIECEFEEVHQQQSHPQHLQMLPNPDMVSLRQLMPHDVRQKEQFIKRGWLMKQVRLNLRGRLPRFLDAA
ncbi:hypothetical protein DYB32_005905 [Aphanomyces invadans]|uniref:C2 tensin-type domain-containing protein n=1 Tax=Aphanomyces invadans TaxID=157072 RepID=A0A418AT82_9STRA|nr:hypothetical protein DYB32_005905 [Aphanomyces invadans]